MTKQGFLRTHPNLFHFIRRISHILTRYGLSTKKIECRLDRYLTILKKYGIRPTFPITARVLDRHGHWAQKFRNSRVDFCLHGYKHTDYTKLTFEESSEHLDSAIDIFRENNMHSGGFRFPYLRFDANCIEALNEHDFKWDSSRSILWEIIDGQKFDSQKLRGYEYMLNQYSYKRSSAYLSVPKFYGKLLEIPVSLPDDDLFERLGLTDSKKAGEILCDILRQTHSRGDLFTLQLHPERIYMFEDSLNSLMRTAKSLCPEVWITSLSDICAWWNEKQSFAVKLSERENSKYEVRVNCSPRGTLLVRTNYSQNKEFWGYTVEHERRFWLESQKCPIVGIPEHSRRELVDFLRNEGFIFEMSQNKGRYSLYLDGFSTFSESDEMPVLGIINRSNLPLIRFWRWPNGCKSALSITGDIDALTTIDYFLRFFGVA